MDFGSQRGDQDSDLLGGRAVMHRVVQIHFGPNPEPVLIPYPLWIRLGVLVGGALACWSGLMAGFDWLEATLAG
jgi:hypothetical protein